MIIEILKRIMTGIAFGGIFTFIALTIMKFNHIESSVSDIWMHMLASLVIGIYFGLSSFIYFYTKWSYLKQMIIHFSLSIVFYYSIALPVGWVPVTPLAIIGSAIAFIIIYAIFGTGYFLYYKKVADSLNEDLLKRK